MDKETLEIFKLMKQRTDNLQAQIDIINKFIQAQMEFNNTTTEIFEKIPYDLMEIEQLKKGKGN